MIPESTEMRLPILIILSDGEPHDLSFVRQGLAQYFNLTRRNKKKEHLVLTNQLLLTIRAMLGFI
jgi:hypothetical protein